MRVLLTACIETDEDYLALAQMIDDAVAEEFNLADVDISDEIG